jgi:hypothetical protein
VRGFSFLEVRNGNPAIYLRVWRWLVHAADGLHWNCDHPCGAIPDRWNAGRVAGSVSRSEDAVRITVYAIAIGRGKQKFDVKVKNAQVTARIWNSIFFGSL